MTYREEKAANDFTYIVNVEAVIYRDDKYLVIRRSEEEEHAPGLLSNVGGKVEVRLPMNDVLEETLIREIDEEVGIKVSRPLYYIESRSFISDKRQIVIDIVFLCKYRSGIARCRSTDEVGEVHWMSGREILENRDAPVWLKESIEKAEKMRLELEAKAG